METCKSCKSCDPHGGWREDVAWCGEHEVYININRKHSCPDHERKAAGSVWGKYGWQLPDETTRLEAERLAKHDAAMLKWAEAHAAERANV